jgi:hypothetical protein
LEELRNRKVIVPPIPVIGRLWAETGTWALRQDLALMGSIKFLRLQAAMFPDDRIAALAGYPLTPSGEAHA